MERILEVQTLGQTLRVGGIDADVDQSELAPVLPTDAAEQRHALSDFLIDVAHQLLRHLHPEIDLWHEKVPSPEDRAHPWSQTFEKRRVAEIEVYRGQIVHSDPRAVTRRQQYSHVAADVHSPVLVSDLAIADTRGEVVDAGLGPQKSHHDVGTAADR